MLFHKSLFSLVMAFAAVSSVAASATPVRRGGGLPGYNPTLNPPISESQCGQQNIQCCNTVISQGDPQFNNLVGSVGILNSVNPKLLAGESCIPIVSGGSCNSQALCCEHNTQNDAVAFDCVPVNLSL